MTDSATDGLAAVAGKKLVIAIRQDIINRAELDKGDVSHELILKQAKIKNQFESVRA